MGIHDLIYRANAGRRKRARKVYARQLAVGLCAVTAVAAFGVITGVLIAPKSGDKLRKDLKKGVTKSVDTIEKAVSKITDKKKKD